MWHCRMFCIKCSKWWCKPSVTHCWDESICRNTRLQREFVSKYPLASTKDANYVTRCIIAPKNDRITTFTVQSVKYAARNPKMHLQHIIMHTARLFCWLSQFCRANISNGHRRFSVQWQRFRLIFTILLQFNLIFVVMSC